MKAQTRWTSQKRASAPTSEFRRMCCSKRKYQYRFLRAKQHNIWPRARSWLLLEHKRRPNRFWTCMVRTTWIVISTLPINLVAYYFIMNISMYTVISATKTYVTPSWCTRAPMQYKCTVPFDTFLVSQQSSPFGIQARYALRHRLKTKEHNITKLYNWTYFSTTLINTPIIQTAAESSTDLESFRTTHAGKQFRPSHQTTHGISSRHWSRHSTMDGR